LRTATVMPLPKEGHMKVQIQLDGNGAYAVTVADWLNDHYPHVDAACMAAPGLQIALSIPAPDNLGDSWPARLTVAMSPLDVAVELVTEAFHYLGLPVANVISVHVTEN
jgi:hypothetical protein